MVSEVPFSLDGKGHDMGSLACFLWSPTTNQ